MKQNLYVNPFVLFSTLFLLASLVFIYVYTQGDLSKLGNMDFRSRASNDNEQCRNRCRDMICDQGNDDENYNYGRCVSNCIQNSCNNQGTPRPSRTGTPRPTISQWPTRTPTPRLTVTPQPTRIENGPVGTCKPIYLNVGSTQAKEPSCSAAVIRCAAYGDSPIPKASCLEWGSACCKFTLYTP